MEKKLAVYRAVAFVCVLGMAFMLYLAHSQNMKLTNIPSWRISPPITIPPNIGNVTISIESSCDLVNWTPAEPGVCGLATPNRFYRIKAEVAHQ